jgi:hypothetical protein
MEGNTAGNNSQRQLLMRCLVTNQQGESGERFVDHTEFPLWQHLLESKHALQISKPTPCVWVPVEECRRHDKLFSHAAYQAPVVKLTYENFDSQTGITEKKVRFALASELELITPVLDEHLGGSNDYVVLETQAGEAISTAPAKSWFRGTPAAAYCAA